VDERRRIDTEPDTKPAPAARRSTPLWIQIVISLVVLGLIAGGWYLWQSMQNQPASGQPGGQVAQQGGGQQGQGGQFRQQGGGGGNFPSGGRGRTVAVVVTAAVTSATINDKLMAIGEGIAFRSAIVTSSSGGTLTELFVKPGDIVKANADIGQLDAQSEQIAFDRATLAANDANDALTRAQELRASNSISAVQLSAAQLAADQAQLELRNAELALERRMIKSPIAGTVGLLQVSAGNLVNAQTTVTTVEDSSEILVNFWVPERYASSVGVGMPVTAIAVALPGQTFAGEVSAVDNRIDPASRTLQVQALLPNPDGKIRPGMSFEVTMSFPGETFPAVDPLSIQWSAEGAYVWKYVDGAVQRAMVQIVERNSAGVLVTGEIALGDQVVTQGVLQLQDGQQVRLLDEPAGEGGNARGNQAEGPPG
jgi:RND family efflux transporter MFP subunit